MTTDTEKYYPLCVRAGLKVETLSWNSCADSYIISADQLETLLRRSDQSVDAISGEPGVFVKLRAYASPVPKEEMSMEEVISRLEALGALAVIKRIGQHGMKE